MKNLPQRLFFVICLTLAVSVAVAANSEAHAEEFEIVIPQGAHSPHCAETSTCFVPDSIEIPVGGIVEWENKGNAAHNIVSGRGFGERSGLFESGILNFDEEFRVDFSGFDSGTYPYFCSIHPWMKGEIILGLSSGISSQSSSVSPDADDSSSRDDDSSSRDDDSSSRDDDSSSRDDDSSSRDDDSSSRDDDSSVIIGSQESTSQIQRHDRMELLPSQRVLDDYVLQVNWIGEFPVTNEINGFELVVTDSKKAKMMMMSHGDGGMYGCGGIHEDQGRHGGMGGHEGGCPHFNMVKKSLPKVAALESGVGNLEDALKMEIIVQGNTYPVQLIEDDAFNGRYYALFIPTIAAQYDVHVYGTIEGSSTDLLFNPAKVIDRNSIITIP